MAKLGVGKIRGLMQIARDNGVFTICALDHRGSFKKMINQADPTVVGYQEMVSRKLELCSSLAGYASAVLLDPIYSAAQCIGSGILPRQTGLLVSVEASGYVEEDKRLARLLDGWGVEKIKRMGAQAVKLLVYYRADFRETAAKQLDTINRVAQDCIRYDLPCLVEAVSYPLGGEKGNAAEFARHKQELVVKAAEDITALPIDVLKAEFPADMAYRQDPAELARLCHKLDAASRVPWVILSRGVDYEVFKRQVEIACQAGASGFLGGRAIWKEVMVIDNAGDRGKFLATTAADRLKELGEIAARYAQPWYRKLNLGSSELTPVAEDWYLKY